MLAELAEYLLTPCPALARRMGYLSQTVAIRARHRRLRQAWAGHTQHCRTLIMQAAARAPGRSLALVLGSGALLDIPLAELAAAFDRVVLADLVHPWSARLAARRYAGVRLVHADLTGSLEEVARGLLPAPKSLDLFTELKPDLVVSANVLSQLPLLPVKALQDLGGQPYQRPELDALAGRLQQEHLSWLDTFSAVRCLITDLESRLGDSILDLLHGLGPRLPGQRWEWNFAPRPELCPDADEVRLVAGHVWSPPETLF